MAKIEIKDHRGGYKVAVGGHWLDDAIAVELGIRVTEDGPEAVAVITVLADEVDVDVERVAVETREQPSES